jgi:hypothetical protein
LRPRPRQGRVDNGAEISLSWSSGDFLFIHLNGIAHRLFHAVEIEPFVAGDATGHFLDEAFSDIPFAHQLLGIGFQQQIENGGRQYMLGKIVRAREGAAGIAAHRFEPREMHGLRRTRGLRRHVFRAALGSVGRFRDEQQSAVVKREPSLPLCVGNAGAISQRLAERRQLVRQIGIFRAQRTQRVLARTGAGHVAGEVHHGVAMRDIDIELVERVATEVLQVFLNLHRDTVPGQVDAQLIAVSPELVGDRRKKDAYRHAPSRPAIRSMTSL